MVGAPPIITFMPWCKWRRTKCGRVLCLPNLGVCTVRTLMLLTNVYAGCGRPTLNFIELFWLFDYAQLYRNVLQCNPNGPSTLASASFKLVFPVKGLVTKLEIYHQKAAPPPILVSRKPFVRHISILIAIYFGMIPWDAETLSFRLVWLRNLIQLKPHRGSPCIHVTDTDARHQMIDDDTPTGLHDTAEMAIV